VIKNGLASSASYPSRRVDGTCHATTILHVDMMMRGNKEVPRLDVFQMLSAVTFVLVVVSITIRDDNKGFMDYKGGMYQGKCETKNDHEPLLVG
jgi:hypothetical protein